MKALFSFKAIDGSFVVGSDVDQAFSDQALADLLRSWNYLTTRYPLKPGNFTEMYFAQDPAIVTTIAPPLCPTQYGNAHGRTLLVCYQPQLVANTWMFVTGGLPDAGGVRNELSQSFLEVNNPGATSWRWLADGYGLLLESGAIDPGGALQATQLVAPMKALFKQRKDAGLLTPLDQLVAMTPAQFDLGGDEGNYAQAGMLFVYLHSNATTRPAVDELIAEVSARLPSADPAILGSPKVTSSEQAFQFLLNRLGKTAAQLQSEYEAFGAQP